MRAPAAPLRLVCDGPALAQFSRRALNRLPHLCGAPVRLEVRKGLRDRSGAVHAGSFPRERLIAFQCPRREFPRIFAHELFHFAWLRLGNPRRWEYEALLRREFDAGARGELGWSAEWRKRHLTKAIANSRGKPWREYCCESFCDSAAWLYSGSGAHREYTLAARFRERRRRWFERLAAAGPLPV